MTWKDVLHRTVTIEKQLNLVELSNKFSKYIFFDNNQEIMVESKEQQDIVAGAKQLIQNCIVLWNYLKLSQVYHDCQSPEEQIQIINSVKNSSIISWSHVNLNGLYDFENEVNQLEMLDFKQISSLNIEE